MPQVVLPCWLPGEKVSRNSRDGRCSVFEASTDGLNGLSRNIKNRDIEKAAPEQFISQFGCPRANVDDAGPRMTV